MSHRLSSDRRPVSLSMLSLNVNSLLNLLVNQSYQGFAFQMGLTSAFLSAAAERRRASLRAVSALSEYGSPVFGFSREDDALISIMSASMSPPEPSVARSARVRSAAPENPRSDTGCFKPSPIAPTRPARCQPFRGPSLGYGSIFAHSWS
jgi:hypothetical protein